MNSRTLRSAIASVDDANCLGICSGYLHLMAFIAFDRMMADNGIVLKGVIYASVATKNRQWHITPEMISQLLGNRFIFVQEDTGYLNTLKLAYESCIGGLIPSIFSFFRYKRMITGRTASENKPFYFCYASCGNPPFFSIDAAFHQRRKLITVELEEGVGTYTGSVHDWRNIGSARAQGLIKRSIFKIYEILVYPWDSWFDRILRKNCPHMLATLFEPQEGTFVTNEKMIPYMREAMRTTSKLQSQSEIPDYTNSVVIVSGKFDTFNWDDAEIAVLRRIIDHLKDRNTDSILRPHPGSQDLTRYEALDVQISQPNGISFEESLNQSDDKPSLIIGFASSALVYANALYEIPSISIEKLLEAEVLERQTNASALKTFMRDTDKIHEAFDRRYERPANYEEFESILEKIFSEQE